MKKIIINGSISLSLLISLSSAVFAKENSITSKEKLINTVAASTGGMIVGVANTIVCATKGAAQGAKEGADQGNKVIPIVGSVIVGTVEAAKGLANGAIKGAKEGVKEGTEKTAEALTNK